MQKFLNKISLKTTFDTFYCCYDNDALELHIYVTHSIYSDIYLSHNSQRGYYDDKDDDNNTDGVIAISTNLTSQV